MKFSHELLLIIIFNFEAIFQAPLVIVANYIMEFATIIKGARKLFQNNMRIVKINYLVTEIVTRKVRAEEEG